MPINGPHRGRSHDAELPPIHGTSVRRSQFSNYIFYAEVTSRVVYK